MRGTVPTEICALERLTLRLEDTGVTCSCCPDDSAKAFAIGTPDSAAPSPEATSPPRRRR